MIKFWKRKEEPKKKDGRVFIVPEEHILEILKLLDRHYANPRKQDHESFYHLWSAIYKLFPDVLEVGSKWEINYPHVFVLKIVEQVD
jgi:hypothetical protein